MNYIGELAALGTAFAFSIGSTMFTLAGRKAGIVRVNRVRLLLAALVVMLVHWVSMGTPLPLDAGSGPWFWLGLSGFIGFTLGDTALFYAFALIGPRLSMLLMAAAPVLATIVAWIALSEQLELIHIVGIIVVLGGIAWVVSDRRTGTHSDSPRTYLIGVLCGLGGATGQALGLVTAKIGMEEGFSTVSGLVIRLVIGTLGIWILALFQRQLWDSLSMMTKDRRAFLQTCAGVIAGPVIGVWLSLVAVQEAPVGISSTLMALTPVFLIPISAVVFKETITRRAVIGTLIAIAGSALLF